MMGGHMSEDSAECACFDPVMVWNHLVIFSVLLRRDANGRPFLPVHRVPQHPQSFYKLRPV
ncbi:MAG: hypothetical protein RLZZ399_2170 [Verrucomicrobiota bacterium]